MGPTADPDTSATRAEGPRAPARGALAASILVLTASLTWYATAVAPAALAPGMAWDFRNCYVSAVAFRERLNPYDPEEQDRIAARTTGSTPGSVLHSGNWIIIPPGNFVFFAPLTLLPFRTAVWVWFALCQVALVGIVVESRRLFGPLGGVPGLLVSLAVLLAVSPVAEALLAGQNSLVHVWFCLLALRLARAGRGRAAGAVLGLALLKYNLSLPLLGYFVLKRRFRAALWAVLVVLLLNVVPLALGDPPAWVAQAQANLEATFGPGGVNFQPNPYASYNDVCLPVLLWRVLPDPSDALHRAIWIIMLSIWAGGFAWGVRRRAPEEIELAALLAFCLLFVYHRNYDAPILFAAGVAVAAAACSGHLRRWEATAAGLLLATFVARNRYEIYDPDVALTPFFVLVRLSYRNWALLALTILLTSIAALGRRPGTAAGAEAPAHPPQQAPETPSV